MHFVVAPLFFSVFCFFFHSPVFFSIPFLPLSACFSFFPVRHTGPFPYIFHALLTQWRVRPHTTGRPRQHVAAQNHRANVHPPVHPCPVPGPHLLIVPPRCRVEEFPFTPVILGWRQPRATVNEYLIVGVCIATILFVLKVPRSLCGCGFNSV